MGWLATKSLIFNNTQSFILQSSGASVLLLQPSLSVGGGAVTFIIRGSPRLVAVYAGTFLSLGEEATGILNSQRQFLAKLLVTFVRGDIDPVEACVCFREIDGFSFNILYGEKARSLSSC